MKTNIIYNEDAIEGLKNLPDKCIQTCVTSPPYFKLRDYGNDKQIGLEETPEEYVDKLVQLFREVRRVLRDDGTLWLNLGDSYNGSGKAGCNPEYQSRHKEFGKPSTEKSRFGMPTKIKNLKPKDLIGIPWMVAFALRADGWYLRQDIIWHKPNPMPESVTDRCTKAHEYIFLLSKSKSYFYDNEAVKESSSCPHDLRAPKGSPDAWQMDGRPADNNHGRIRSDNSKRNKHSVWKITAKPFSGAHFAVFPMDLIEPCILAGSSDKACEVCGSPYERIVEKKEPSKEWLKSCGADSNGEYKGKSTKDYSSAKAQDASATKARILQGMASRETIGFQPTCICNNEGTSRSIVLDPFMGSGTTAITALKHRRDFIGFELNPEYVAIAEKRIKDNPGPPTKKITEW